MVSFVLFLSFQIFAAEPTMNGYSAKQFGDVVKNWRLVTVRYRKDTGEMRFTYANETAWKTLQANRIDYPDGSVFAKLGVMTRQDPAFPSSMEPGGARRMQFMVRNQKRHTNADGWGYALFDMEGKLFPEDVDKQTQACVACHRLVPDRGYVFSQPMGLQSSLGTRHLEFSDEGLSKLPVELKKLVKDFSFVRSLQGTLRKNLFFGTLDEIRPSLALEAIRSKRPAALISQDHRQFSVVIPLKSSDCAQNETPVQAYHTLAPNKPLFELRYCQENGH